MTKKDEKDNPGDNFSEMNDDLDSLSLDEKAAFEKIMAEIGEMNKGEATESHGTESTDMQRPGSEESNVLKDRRPEDPDPPQNHDLSEEQQAALDNIMAEINARETAKETESQPVQDAQPDTQPPADDDEKLSDEQQAALDKIMADINAREAAKETESQPGGDGTSNFGPDDVEEKPEKETEKLSLEEFNDELAALLSSAQPNTEKPGTKTGAFQKQADGVELKIAEPLSARDSESPPLKFGPAPQAVSEAAEPVQAAPSPEVQGGPSGPGQQEYVILQEIDSAQIIKAGSKNRAKPKKQKTGKFGRFVRIGSLSMLVMGMAAAAYWGYDLFLHNRIQIPGLATKPVAEKPIFRSGDTKTAIEKGSLSQMPPAMLENSGPAMQQSSPTSFSSLKSDLMAARQLVNKKIEEILDLKAHYQNGILDEQDKIRSDLQTKPARSLEIARASSQVDLSMRAIQRRMVYSAKLDSLLSHLETSSEDLLYLERRTQLFETLSQWVSGPSIPEYKQDVIKRIQSHIKVITELKVDDIQVDPPPMASIWKDVLSGMDKQDNGAADRTRRKIQDQQISQEICKGEYDRKYLLTSLSLETARCLTQWSGKDLYLNGLTELSPRAAEILVRWPGEWLSLNGVKEISVETAKYLSQWPGKRLSMNGLEKLSPQATAQLSRWRGEQLEMIGLTAIGRWENYATRLYLSEKLRRKLQM